MNAPRRKAQAKAIAIVRRTRAHLAMIISGIAFLLFLIARYQPA